MKYFAKGKEVYNEYYGNRIRISAQHVPEYKPIMMAKKWLLVIGKVLDICSRH